MHHCSARPDLLSQSKTNLVQAFPHALKSHCASESGRGDQMDAMEELMMMAW
jgi:hypothetical protein